MATAGSAPGEKCSTAVAKPVLEPPAHCQWLASHDCVGTPATWVVEGSRAARTSVPSERGFVAVTRPALSTGSPSPRPASPR